ncbi:MAG: hypothetical protein V5A88_01260 [Candidatus Thermoplasmatota archaeon]
MRVKKRGLIKPLIVGMIYFFFFVVLAIGLILYVQTSYPEFQDIFQNTIFYIMIFGSILAVFGALTAYFEKGEFLRMVSGITKAGILIAYVLVVYDSLNVTLGIENGTASVSFPGLINLKVIFLILYGTYYVFEYVLYRREERLNKNPEVH